MSDSSTIVPIELDAAGALAMFTKESEFDGLLKKIKEQTDSLEPDVSTAAGRDEIKSVAYKITRTKTTLDELGKQVKADAQKTVDQVDDTRRRMREKLDALKEQVRKPVTEYESKAKEKKEKIELALCKLADLRQVPFNATIADIKRMQQDLTATYAAIEDWGDLQGKAEILADAARAIHSPALQSVEHRERQEEENRRLQAEREAFAAQQREREQQELARAAELERQENAHKEAQAKQQAEMEQLQREKQAAEERAARAEREAKEAAERAEREAAEKSAAAERQEREQREAEERRKAEAAAAAKAEAARKQQEADELDERLKEAGEDLARVIADRPNEAIAGLSEFVLTSIVDGAIRNVTFK